MEYLVDLISSYGILERFLDHLGVIFEPSWPCCMWALGVMLGLKTAKAVRKLSVLCFVELLGDILEYLGDLTSSHGILEPCWGHLGAILGPHLAILSDSRRVEDESIDIYIYIYQKQVNT